MRKPIMVFLACLILMMQTTIFAQQVNKIEPQQTKVQGLPASYTDTVTGMEFVLIKGGCYMMGDNFYNGDPDSELPVHEVCVDDFYLGKYHVTNEQFKLFTDATRYRTTAEIQGTGFGLKTDKPSDGGPDWLMGLDWIHPVWPNDNIERKMNHPVAQVSWHDAKKFAQWLKGRTGKDYRLAYEAEYEYAIRNGGKKHNFAWGDEPISGNVADISLAKILIQRKKSIFKDYDDGYAFTSPVGSFKPNEIGLYDMTGNVFSWVEDWFSKDYYKNIPKNNPHGPVMAQSKVARGGSWSKSPWMDRASCRYDIPPDTRMADIGFRLALSVKDSTTRISGQSVQTSAPRSGADKNIDQSTSILQRANIALKRSYRCGTPNLHDLSTMLKSHNFSTIDKQYDDLLRLYKEDEQCEQYLQVSYNLFKSENHISIDDLDLWVTKTGSYIAYAARGIYKAQEGFQIRGSRSHDLDNAIGPTPSNIATEVTRWHQDAAKDLMTAIDKNSLLMPAYAWLVSIAKASSLPLTTRQILQQAEAIDMRTFYVRYEFINSLKPRWGGSYEEMAKFASQIQRFNTLNPRLWSLQGEADADRADTKFADGDYKSAIELYTAALQFGDHPLWLNKRSFCYNQIGVKDKSVADSGRIFFYNPNDSVAMDNYQWNKKYHIEYEIIDNTFISPNIKKEGIRTYVVLPVEYDVKWAIENKSKLKGVDIAKRNIDKIELMLLQLGFDCVERSKLDALLSEQKLSLTGLTIDKAQYVGRLVNADTVIITSIPSMGKHLDPFQYFEDINIKAVSVASGKIMWKSILKGSSLRGVSGIDDDIVFDNIETKLYERLQNKLKKEIL